MAHEKNKQPFTSGLMPVRNLDQNAICAEVWPLYGLHWYVILAGSLVRLRSLRRGMIISHAVALTSQAQRAGFPLTLELSVRKLPKRSWVKISQIRTLSTNRIGTRIGRLSPEELSRVIEGLNEIIGD